MDFGLSPAQKSSFRWFASSRGRAWRHAPRRSIRPACIPRDLVGEAAALGLMGITIRPEFGGAGRDYVSYAAAIEALAAASATLAVIIAVHTSLVAEPLQEFGTPEQQSQWLPALARGDAIGAFALSEAQSGSDAANQRTVAHPEDTGYRLHGEKVWVANAEAAALVLVFAATQPGEGGRGISAFLLPIEAPGLTRVASPDSLGVRGLGCMDLTLVRRPRGPRRVARPARRRVWGGEARPRGRPRRDCGAIARRRPGGARRSAQLCAPPRGLRPSDRRVSSDPVPARRSRRPISKPRAC